MTTIDILLLVGVVLAVVIITCIGATLLQIIIEEVLKAFEKRRNERD